MQSSRTQSGSGVIMDGGLKTRKKEISIEILEIQFNFESLLNFRITIKSNPIYFVDESLCLGSGFERHHIIMFYHVTKKFLIPFNQSLTLLN